MEGEWTPGPVPFIGGQGEVHKQKACGISLVNLMSLGHCQGRRVICGRARLISLVHLAMEVGAHGLWVGMLRQQETVKLYNFQYISIQWVSFPKLGTEKGMYQISSHLGFQHSSILNNN